jgi:hypothetical protein
MKVRVADILNLVKVTEEVLQGEHIGETELQKFNNNAN